MSRCKAVAGTSARRANSGCRRSLPVWRTKRNKATESATPARAVRVSGVRRRQPGAPGAAAAGGWDGAGLSMSSRRQFHADQADIVVEYAAGGELAYFGNQLVEKLRGGQGQQ